MSDFDPSGIADPNAEQISDSPDTPEVQQIAAPEAEADNPAWKELLDELPDLFRDKAKPHLTKWDQNYRTIEQERNALKEKYTPFEPYVGVDPQNIQYGLNLLQGINTQPQVIYEMLTGHLRELGLLPAEGQQQQDPNQQNLDENPEQTELRQRQEETDRRTAQLEEYIAQQEYNRTVDTFEGQLKSELETFRSAHPGVDEQDLLNRINIQVQSGQPWNVEAAFRDQVATFQRIYQAQTQGGRRAPQIIPTNGTPAPSETIPVEKMNYDQRAAYMKALIDAGNNQ